MAIIDLALTSDMQTLNLLVNWNFDRTNYSIGDTKFIKKWYFYWT